MAVFLLFRDTMRRLATLLVVAVIGLGAGQAVAGRGAPIKKAGKVVTATAKRMATKLAQSTKGASKERPRNQTSRNQKIGLLRAASRQNNGLDGSESKRARQLVARGIGDGDGRPKQTLKRSLKVALQKRGRQ